MRKVISKGTGAALAVFLAAAPLLAKDSKDDLKKEIEDLKAGQAAILKQLDEIKKLIGVRNAPPLPAGPNVKDVVFDLGANPTKGAASAKVTLLEFSDYQCPFCSKYARETYPKIATDFIDTGKIRYAMMDVPLPMHAKAMDAAKATRCADDQGKFWEMHKRLFDNQQALEPWNGHAEALGLNVPDFETCMKSDKHAQAIQADLKEAQKGGITATPTFMLAMTDPKDPKKVKGIVAMVGAKSYDAFKADIEKALAAN